mgnify:CR=1 FL=1
MSLKCDRCESSIPWPTAAERSDGWWCPICDVKDPTQYNQEEFISFLQQELEELQLIVIEIQEQLCGKSK